MTPTVEDVASHEGSAHVANHASVVEFSETSGLIEDYTDNVVSIILAKQPSATSEVRALGND